MASLAESVHPADLEKAAKNLNWTKEQLDKLDEAQQGTDATTIFGRQETENPDLGGSVVDGELQRL